MEKFDIYEDIAERTGGEIFLGVVGPVRTGKSTFIAKFMEQMILPKVPSKQSKMRMLDEMPQAGSGTTVTTSEPKFCPSEAVNLNFGTMSCKVRLCDCAGYMVNGAEKSADENRKIKTMWSDRELTFDEVADIGTSKVLKEHSTIAVMVTTDGSIIDIPRENYIKAERRTVAELKDSRKPFIVVLNTKYPDSAETKKLLEIMEGEYKVKIVAKDIVKMEEAEVSEILQEVASEFKVKKYEMEIPRWMQALDRDDDLICRIFDKIEKNAFKIDKMKESSDFQTVFEEGDLELFSEEKDISKGVVKGKFQAREGLFYEVLSRECGLDIKDEFELICLIKELKKTQDEHEKMKAAITEMETTGYGMVMPKLDELELFEPELMKEGNQYGVRLRAKAPSIHMIKIDVETEIHPIVGTEAQGEALVKNMLKDFENDKQEIWNTNMFGKPLSEMIKEGLTQKLVQMPYEVRAKMKKTVTRIVNEGKGGVICILL